MTKKILYILLSVGCVSYGQTARKYSNEFLNIGVDAAALGMANSVIAQTGDVNSAYWNPSGLVNLESKEVALMHASYFANIAQYDYAAFAMPIDEKSAVALSMIRFGVDDILNTTELIDQNGNIDYNRISLFSTADYAFTASYARKLNIEGLSVGANAKVVRRIIGKFANSWGFGFDVGMQYKTASNWQFGAMVRDITTTYNTWSINKKEFDKIKDAVPGQNQDLPETNEITLPKLQLGAAKNFGLTEDLNLMAALVLHSEFAQTNAVISTKGFSLQPSAGVEFGYANMVFVRGGVGNFQNELQIDGNEKVTFQPNLGVGFRYKGIQVDYALTNIGEQSAALYSNIFSLKLDLSIFSK
ncbi:PorV/PorQ family protein [Flavobacterium sp. I3-2]|uniref:putative type IX sorting system protein PorV2 n=1 Tax=Flavobacterium sp. I3-2 TaxID=2748319 RepID=UPI0015A899E6|nr:PorV/PorQ family protein [Flavobacterium sp. I3-2]